MSAICPPSRSLSAGAAGLDKKAVRSICPHCPPFRIEGPIPIGGSYKKSTKGGCASDTSGVPYGSEGAPYL
jgi:hypothetical protein